MAAIALFSVSDINMRVKQLVDTDRTLADVYVRGELSNYKVYPSGHHYFTMKDESGVLRAVMFKNDAVRLQFRPETGMRVIVRGRVAVYVRDGQYQLYASEMIAEGAGALYVAFEQLKEKLRNKGYFDQERKKPIPRYPMQICLITSPAGAAVRDMLRILKKRWPVAKILIIPTRVQGAEAPEEIAAAITYANRWNLGELIITGRGGGSIEDLWAFNDERVADAIYHSRIPVISAVGHEPDVTIADFVADLRAATPSNAAELSVPDTEDFRGRLNACSARIADLEDRQLKLARQRLNAIADRRVLTSPLTYIQDRRMQLDRIAAALDSAAGRYLSRRRERFGKLAASLDAMSPLKVLGRGYAIATKSDGKAVKSGDDVVTGELIDLRLAQGMLGCRVETIG